MNKQAVNVFSGFLRNMWFLEQKNERMYLFCVCSMSEIINCAKQLVIQSFIHRIQWCLVPLYFIVTHLNPAR
jgi:hypothetical protein